MVIPKGAFFLVSVGEYSDYEVLVLCRASVDLHTIALVDEFLAEFGGSHDHPRHFAHHQFVKWLTVDKVHMVEEIPYLGWHLHDYFTIKTLRFSKEGACYDHTTYDCLEHSAGF